jgi:biotin---protein ligase
VSNDVASVPSLSSLHLSSINHTEVGELLYTWEGIMDKENGEEYIRGENDTFHIQNRSSRWSLSDLKTALPSNPDQSNANAGDQSHLNGLVEYSTILKPIVPHEQAWPDIKETPNFHHTLYYSSLKAYRETEEAAEDWGNNLIYGEVVTSTNTLLEK